MIATKHDIDQEIIAAAVQRLGCHEAQVYEFKQRPYQTATFQTWYWLNIRRAAGGEWEPIGRRVSKEELLKLAGGGWLIAIVDRCFAKPDVSKVDPRRRRNSWGILGDRFCLKP